MSEDGAGADGAAIEPPVVFVFRWERPDAAEAVKAMQRSTAVGKLLRPVVVWPLCVLVAGLVVWEGMTRGDFGQVWEIALFLVLAAMPPLMTHHTLKAARRQGEQRVVVDGDGLRVKNDLAEARLEWRNYRGWQETPHAFVLLGHKETRIYQVLPKRACADSGELDRARAMFAEHLPAL